jgi:hypothetical protein
MKRVLLILCWAVCILVGFVAWVAFQPPAGRPNMAIAFAGYTNDSSGVRLAQFSVTNMENSSVDVQLRTVEIRNVTNLWVGAPAGPISSHASRSFTVKAPDEHVPWRVSMIVYPERGKSALMKSVASEALRRGRIRTRYQIRFYFFYSEWIGNEEGF